jgi:PPOX class probable F420-dependent enzyme
MYASLTTYPRGDGGGVMAQRAQRAAKSSGPAEQTGTRFSGKYLSITSFRANGSGVATPVWFVEEDGRLYVDTDGSSYKAKRIRANPQVLVAPCTASGRLKAQTISAHAAVIAGMPASARHSYEHKYRVDRVLIAPVYRLVQALRHKKAPTGQPVALVIDPENSRGHPRRPSSG